MKDVDKDIWFTLRYESKCVKFNGRNVYEIKEFFGDFPHKILADRIVICYPNLDIVAKIDDYIVKTWDGRFGVCVKGSRFWNELEDFISK